MSRFVPLGVEAEQILTKLRNDHLLTRLEKSPGRNLLKRLGLIESHRPTNYRGHAGHTWRWRLTEAGRAEAERIAREPR